MNGNKKTHGFHELAILGAQKEIAALHRDSKFKYTFQNFFHPRVDELIQKLNKESIEGLLNPNYHQVLEEKFFDSYYQVLNSNVVSVESFPKGIDVGVEGDGAYANYNWELLFHIPLTIAVHLSKNQRFAEAQRWFHYIFDPACDDQFDPAERRFWKFIAFRKQGSGKQIDELLTLLSKPDVECTEAEKEQKKKILDGYYLIKKKPFQPHVVARTRFLSYQYCVVMKYLDNLIAWGDSLFRQDTIESINEATQRYVLAANILGRKPQIIPHRGIVRPKSFAQLKELVLDPMGNALVELEGEFPFNLDMPQTPGLDSSALEPLFGIGHTLYFCIPHNDNLLKYYDIVADRLFKIRHCLNIEGVARQLALFDPPLDPGMLVKAAAAGINIGSIIQGLNQPIGPVRSQLLIQKALELCAEVRNLGSALLSAIEKGDSEHMALLRQSHEIKIQEMTKETRFLQWKQGQESTEALLRGRSSALERYHYYQRLLGLTPDESVVPEPLALDRRDLTEENFDEVYSALVGQYEKSISLLTYPPLKLAGDTSPANQSGASGKGKLYLNANEDAELNSHLITARDTRLAASVAETVASVLTFIPEINVNLQFWGMGTSPKVAGGSKFSDATKIAAEVLRTVSAWEQDQAGIASRTASYERRADEWMLQCNLAARELMHIGRQLIGSLISEQIAHHEYLTVAKQIENSKEVDLFLQEKFSNEELYAWMQGEISRLYYEYYRLAFDTARKAEQTMKHELMRPEVDNTTYIKFNYWDAGRKGLLSAEALYLDIKQMEMAYHENNKREYELIKHVSLKKLDPIALLSLKATGTCQFVIPEWLFDLDCPGHYMRRIKNVRLSIPSVTGPYTSVNCTLSLQKSSARISPLLEDDEYKRQPTDKRFIDYFGMIQSIVTSSGNLDSGMFETNLHEERFLPFEGAGAESTWKLELPTTFRQFDYDTISDVILHLHYTARQGGDLLRTKAVENIDTLVGVTNESGLALVFSLNHEFPNEWYSFLTGNSNFVATIKSDYFPYFTDSEDKTINIDAVQIFAIQDKQLKHTTPVGLNLASYTTALQDDEEFELSLSPDGAVLLRDKQAQVFVIIKYSLS